MSAKMYQSPMGLSISWPSAQLPATSGIAGLTRTEMTHEASEGRAGGSSARLTGSHTIDDQTSYTRGIPRRTLPFHFQPHRDISNVEL